MTRIGALLFVGSALLTSCVGLPKTQSQTHTGTGGPDSLHQGPVQQAAGVAVAAHDTYGVMIQSAVPIGQQAIMLAILWFAHRREVLRIEQANCLCRTAGYQIPRGKG